MASLNSLCKRCSAVDFHAKLAIPMRQQDTHAQLVALPLQTYAWQPCLAPFKSVRVLPSKACLCLMLLCSCACRQAGNTCAQPMLRVTASAQAQHSSRKVSALRVSCTRTSACTHFQTCSTHPVLCDYVMPEASLFGDLVPTRKFSGHASCA
jgi:hypothetical protein